MGFIWSSQSFAVTCTIFANKVSEFESLTTFELEDKGAIQKQFTSGLSCDGVALNTSTRTYLRYQTVSLSNELINSQTNDKIQIQYFGNDRSTPLSPTAPPVDISFTNGINVFEGTDKSVRFYYSIPAGQVVAPGIYKISEPLKIQWWYSVPGIGVGVIGILYENSPGFQRPLNPFTKDPRSWGTGVLASIDIQIEIKADCSIETKDVNFTPAPFADAFQPVVTEMGVRCSSKTPYNVSLNNGSYPQGGNQRAMKHASSNNFLKYEIYKNQTSQRWGQAGEKWSSSDASINPGIHDGLAQQKYTFTTRILNDNPQNLPAGEYTDNVTVTVDF